MAVADYYAPTGTIVTEEDIFLEGGPEVYIGGVLQNAPDSDSFYWGVSGVAGNPVYSIGCYEDFRFRDNVAVTDIRCDTVGSKGTIQKRNYLEAQFNLKSLFPLTMLRLLMRGGAVTTNATENTEKMGLGEIDQNVYFMVYFSRVYDDDAGDYVSVTGHRCQVVDAWELATPYGAPWMISVRVRMYADDTLPVDQRFATVIRYDPSAL